MTSNIFVDWNCDMDDDFVPAPEDYIPANVDKTPTAEDGPQPEQPCPLTQYGVLPEEDPYG